MHFEVTNKLKRQNKRQNYSNLRSNPFEHVFHNPILKSINKSKISPLKPAVARDLSLKVLDLKLPAISVTPKIYTGYMNTPLRTHLVQKVNYRPKSIISEIHLAPSRSLIKFNN
ncbi:hypothetical protein SteCoe_4355 [Stentor coeruleus]|uniref:Uncharacterized protein n=1 Tax=Stentor coeruleus TaxID=5963 RepID=A0A1R2CV15_9CILI|nr:hypothetical protein SteCoe_4355 [Stentor coeruleus]